MKKIYFNVILICCFNVIFCQANNDSNDFREEQNIGANIFSIPNNENLNQMSSQEIMIFLDSPKEIKELDFEKLLQDLQTYNAPNININTKNIAKNTMTKSAAKIDIVIKLSAIMNDKALINRQWISLNDEFLCNKIKIKLIKIHDESISLQITTNISKGDIFYTLFLGQTIKTSVYAKF